MTNIIQFPGNITLDRNEINIFRTPFPEREPGQIYELGERFNIHGEAADHGASLVLRDENGDLELFHPTDSLWWADVKAMSQEPSGPVDLPTEPEALEIAEHFLREKDLFDDRCRVHSVSYAEFAEVESEEHEPESFRFAMRINYQYFLDHLPVFGPGAKIGVTIGAERNVIDCFKFWREPVHDHSLELIDPEAAMRLIRQDPAFAQLKEGESSVNFHQMKLGYYALPCMEYQGFLAPVYVFEGTANTPAQQETPITRHVVAVHTSLDEMKEKGAVFQNPVRVW